MPTPRRCNSSTTRTVPSTVVGLFVAGHQESEATRVPGVVCHEPFGGDDHGGQARLHVGGTAAVQKAVANGGLEGRRRPGVHRPTWHYVGMAGKYQPWFRNRRAGVRAGMDGPEVVDFAEAHPLHPETGVLEPVDEQFLASGIVGRNRGVAPRAPGVSASTSSVSEGPPCKLGVRRHGPFWERRGHGIIWDAGMGAAAPACPEWLRERFRHRGLARIVSVIACVRPPWVIGCWVRLVISNTSSTRLSECRDAGTADTDAEFLEEAAQGGQQARAIRSNDS